MPLKLNLYHEISREKRAKRRDPLKLSMFGLAGVGLLFAGYYFVELGQASSLRRELADSRAKYAALEPKAAAAKEREESLAATIKIGDALVQRIENRFYWASLFEQLTKLVPPEVQILKLAGDVQTSGGEKKGSITIDGVSAGADPRRVAEELRTAITEQFSKQYEQVSSAFRSLEDGTELVKVNGGQWPTAAFAINVQLLIAKEQTSAPTPTRIKK